MRINQTCQRWLRTSYGLAALATLGGCSNDEADHDGGGGAGGASEWATGPVYINTTRVFGVDSSTGYMVRLHSLEDDQKIDLKQAVELDEDAWVFGNADPYFYTASVFSPMITQWSLDKSGDFVKGKRLSLVNEGVAGTYSAAFTPIYSTSKAYFVDGGSGQVVVWNPEKMTLLGTIPVDVSLPDDHDGPKDVTPYVEMAVRDEQLLVSVFWGSQTSGWTQTAGLSRLITIDPKTDKVTKVVDEPRCESVAPAGTTSDGTTYYSPYDYLAAVGGIWNTPGYGAKSCALRVQPAQTAFEASYDVDLSALVGGKPAGSAFLVDDDHLLLHVWEESLVKATKEDWIDDQRWESGYQWYRWKIGDEKATLIEGQQPSGEGGSWQKIDGKLVSYSANAEYSKTTLQWIEADGSLRSGLTLPGWTVATIRAR